jgi:sec-independent protein translocase protein TatB
MFEVGFTEIVLILGIALLVLGPARLPKLAADVGRWAGKARAMARQLKSQLEQEASTFNDLRNPLDDTTHKSHAIHEPATAAKPAEPAGAASQPDASAATAAATDKPTDTPDATNESKPA